MTVVVSGISTEDNRAFHIPNVDNVHLVPVRKAKNKNTMTLQYELCFDSSDLYAREDLSDISKVSIMVDSRNFVLSELASYQRVLDRTQTYILVFNRKNEIVK